MLLKLNAYVGNNEIYQKSMFSPSYWHEIQTVQLIFLKFKVSFEGGQDLKPSPG